MFRICLFLGAEALDQVFIYDYSTRSQLATNE